MCAASLDDGTVQRGARREESVWDKILRQCVRFKRGEEVSERPSQQRTHSVGSDTVECSGTRSRQADLDANRDVVRIRAREVRQDRDIGGEHE